MWLIRKCILWSYRLIYICAFLCAPEYIHALAEYKVILSRVSIYLVKAQIDLTKSITEIMAILLFGQVIRRNEEEEELFKFFSASKAKSDNKIRLLIISNGSFCLCNHLFLAPFAMTRESEPDIHEQHWFWIGLNRRSPRAGGSWSWSDGVGVSSGFYIWNIHGKM